MPPEWLDARYGLDRAASPDAAYQAASLAETANLRDGTASGGRLSAWESYLWDLDPTDSSQYPHAEIEMVDGAPRVKVVPASASRPTRSSASRRSMRRAGRVPPTSPTPTSFPPTVSSKFPSS